MIVLSRKMPLRRMRIRTVSLMWRMREEEKFLELCRKGDLETVKTLLADDPSLINCKDPDYSKFKLD